jgi:hypothetical protein
MRKIISICALAFVLSAAIIGCSSSATTQPSAPAKIGTGK